MQARLLISDNQSKRKQGKNVLIKNPPICDNRTLAVSQVVNKRCCYSPHQRQCFLQMQGKVLQKEEVFKRVQIMLITIVNVVVNDTLVF